MENIVPLELMAAGEVGHVVQVDGSPKQNFVRSNRCLKLSTNSPKAKPRRSWMSKETTLSPSDCLKWA